jgi:DNA-binding response OmpR family regulator
MQLATSTPSTCFARPRLSSHRERVFLIEACAVTAAVAARSLEDHGYQVTWFESAEKAVASFLTPEWFGRSCPADVVILDTDRLEMDLATFAEILRLSNAPPLILLGSQPMENMRSLVSDVNAAGAVHKPLNPQDLLPLVRRSLSRHRPKQKVKEHFFSDLTRPVASGLLS